jgi:hypothetical protein
MEDFCPDKEARLLKALGSLAAPAAQRVVCSKQASMSSASISIARSRRE